MILPLIKKINDLITELSYSIQCADKYINDKYTCIYLAISRESYDVVNIVMLSEYIYYINYYLYKIFFVDKSYINAINQNKIKLVNSYIADLSNNINNNINIKDVSVYIKNSNTRELLLILYLLYIIKSKDATLYATVSEKIYNKITYLRLLTVYAYDSMFHTKYPKGSLAGLTDKYIENTSFINLNSDFNEVDKNKIKIHDSISNQNAFINDYVIDYYSSLQLTATKYNNFINNTSKNDSVEIQIYNNYVKKLLNNSNKTERIEMSIFELFKL